MSSPLLRRAETRAARYSCTTLTCRANKDVAEDAKAPSAGAKSLCIPFDQERFGAFPDGEQQKCIQCGEKAKRWTLFGRSESLHPLCSAE